MRAGRLVSLMILLQDHGRMSAPTLARELEVSQRTIMRDIEALSGAGVPVFAVRGAHGGFELLGAYGRELPRPAGRSGEAGQRRGRLSLSPAGQRIVAVTGRPTGVRVRGRRSDSTSGSGSGSGSTDRWAEASMPIDSLDAAVLEVLALGDEVEVLGPDALRSAVAATAERVVNRYRQRLATSDQPSPTGSPVDARAVRAAPRA